MNKIKVLIVSLSLFVLNGCDVTDTDNTTLCPNGIKIIFPDGSNAGGSINADGQDCFRFQAETSNEYTIELIPYVAGLDISVYEDNSFSSDSLFAEKLDVGEVIFQIPLTVEESKEIFISVRSSQNNGYDLSVKKSNAPVCSYFGAAGGCPDNTPYSCPSSAYCSSSPTCNNLSDCY